MENIASSILILVYYFSVAFSLSLSEVKVTGFVSSTPDKFPDASSLLSNVDLRQAIIAEYDTNVFIMDQSQDKFVWALSGVGGTRQHFFGERSPYAALTWSITEKFSYTNIDSKNGVVTVGSGVGAFDLVQQLIKKNFMLPCPDCISLNIAGVTLGGGYGTTSRTHGLLIQNLLSIRLLDENGEILTSSAAQNTDLFFALRGAGDQGFGLVLDFTFKLLPLPKNITNIFKRYSDSKSASVIKKWIKWAETNPNKAINSLLHYNSDSDNKLALSVILLSETEAENKELLLQIADTFTDINDDDISYLSYNESLSNCTRCESVFTVMTHEFYVQKELNTSEIDALTSSIMTLQCKFCTFILEMAGGYMANNSNNAFIHGNSLFRVRLDISIPRIFGYQNAMRIRSESFQIVETFESKTKSSDSGYSYQNYIRKTRSDWTQRSYGHQREKIFEIHQIYSSKNMFHCELCDSMLSFMKA